MKRAFAILFFVSGLSMAAQWEPVFDLEPDNEYLSGGLCFVNDSTGYTTKFIDEWPALTSQILKTTNWGEDWEVVYTHTDFNDFNADLLSDVFFLNDSLGWACGIYQPYVLFTSDSGHTWIEQPFPDTTYLGFGMVKFADENFGICLSQYNGARTIVTYDGGMHWDYDEAFRGYDVSFLDNCNFVINAGGELTNAEECTMNIIEFPSVEGNPHRTGRAIWMLSNEHWVIGALGLIGFNNFSSIITTDDGGQTFSILDFPFGIGTESIKFINDEIGYASIWNGTPTHSPLLKTFDGGTTWYETETPFLAELGDHISFDDIAFPSENVGYGISGDIVYRTLTGGGEVGQMWTVVDDNIPTIRNFAIYPNPANESLQINFAHATDADTKIEILDLNGKLVHSERMQNHCSTTILDVAYLVPGMYILKLISEMELRTRSFVKE